MSNFTTTRPAIATTPAYCEVSPLTQGNRTTIAQVGKGFNYSAGFPQWVEIGRSQVVKGELLSEFRATTIAQNALAQLSTSDEDQEVAA